MMIALFVCLFIIGSFAATTPPHPTHHHRTHATREPSVIEAITFRYDPASHLMAAMTHHKCYIYSMTSAETVEVHTSHGLHALEGKLITMIDDATAHYQTMSHADLTTASKTFAHTCNRAGWTTYKLN